MFTKQSSATWKDIAPISAELFGPERFEQHAQSLAITQKITKQRINVYSVVRRLDDNAAVLLQVYRDICAAIAVGKTVTPAAEWLADNYHLVEEQISQTQADLPERFYRQLPKLADGPLAGHPRIFGTVWAYIAHTDSHFDPLTFSNFINAYQSVEPLTIGELWAAAIAIRLILIENLRRISQRMNNARLEREAADYSADKILDFSASKDDLWKEFEAHHQQVSIPFSVQLLQRLRDLDDARATQVLEWLQIKVGQQGHTLETAVSDEHNRQAAANVTVRNIVQSLRLVADINWETWFDGVSVTDKSFRTIPLYEQMDFQSRNLYRTAVEELARGSNTGEIEIVNRVLDHMVKGEDTSAEPGHWLIGNGRTELEQEINFKPPLLGRLRNLTKRAGLWGYLGVTLAFIAIFEALIFTFLNHQGSAFGTTFMLLGLAVIPASEVAISVVNILLSRLLDTRMSPSLALRDGVPEHLRTLVAIPCLLTSGENVEELIDRLEVHFLSSGSGELYFALVSDWIDSDVASSPADLSLLERSLGGIDELNRRHETQQFILLHRRRSFDKTQNKWMGWERKRGKLHELNRLLRGAVDTNFETIGGTLPPNVRYVITLDADTRLPRDAARRLVGKMAHPLNTPIFDSSKRRVVAGHGILQPRVTAALPTGHRGSYFQRLFSTARGIDPYVFAASDIYQDLFDEGSFTGKGIYDVDIFELALAGKIPENTVLSHDLFEGNFARSGLVSDIEVIDDFPEQYEVSAARQHRWVRGDWQLLPWILGLRNTGPISGLGRWKMIDNLRRSLLPIFQLVGLIVGWTLLSNQPAMIWTVIILFSNFVPVLIPTIVDGFRISPHSSAKHHFSIVKDNIKQAILLGIAQFVFLSNQATLMADAILRTLYRLVVSKKNLLEWTTAAQVQALAKPGLWRSYLQMLSAPLIAIILLDIVFIRGIDQWYMLSMVAFIWFAAPAIAHWVSHSEKLDDGKAASESDTRALRAIARRTYRYFEDYVTSPENMLPPDNFQEDPDGRIAHRTSPTNIGLYLLSTVAAREFGWLGIVQAIDKIEPTFASIHKLEKFRGHLFNWYDTQSLMPLEPKYVSTVDSGNLAGHLLALANCFDTWALEPDSSARRSVGIDDILEILTDEANDLPQDRSILKPMRKSFVQQITTLKIALQKARIEPDLFGIRLVELSILANKIFSTAARLATEISGESKEAITHWSIVLRSTVESHFQDASIDATQAAHLKQRLKRLALDARSIAYAMEFGYLFDPQRDLLSIGYRMNEAMRDESCYDMLASEARLASFFAIAKGDLKTRHWFKLGRTLTALKGGAALVSWSGSMFEYLMPSLVMRAPCDGMLDQTTKLVVSRQIEYAKGFKIPWGISESAFSARDVNFTYQYSNFGVPGLGLKRGLASNLVIAPYATGLASMVSPPLAMRNYEALKNIGALGKFGFYESLDYTPARLQSGKDYSVVRAYFAHHQGMTIVAILNATMSGIARNWFHNEPRIRATELLLQERAPRDVSESKPREAVAMSHVGDLSPSLPRIVHPFMGTSPSTHIMSNGHYSVMMTAAGSGYSTWNGLAITRWREDPVADNWGQFIYLREPRTGNWWSASHMPSGKLAEDSTTSFSEHKFETTRKDGNWTTTLECIVSPESNAEARRITIANRGLTSRDIEITTFAELVLAPAASDVSHPAFSKLFVETEFISGIDALIATRRKRSPDDPEMWVAQVLLVDHASMFPLEYETDRGRFIGRCRDISDPVAMTSPDKLSNTTGAVLDPIFSIRRKVNVPRGRQIQLTLWTMVAATKEAVLDLVDQHGQDSAFDRALMLAWTQGQIQLRHLSITPEDADLYQKLGSAIIYSNASFRPPNVVLINDMGSQSTLWSQSISGDKPIVLVRIDNIEDIEVVRQMVRAFEYWKSKRIAVDLVILNDRMSSYVQDLQVALDALVRKLRTPTSPELANHLGEIYVLRADLVPKDTLKVLAACARIVLFSRRGSISSQLNRLNNSTQSPATKEARTVRQSQGPTKTILRGQGLQFYNGQGGFTDSSDEYVIFPTVDNPTPAPWINVIANPNLGFHASSDGAGYTWFGNSKEAQLTTWSNDPISNRSSEAFYVSDLESGLLSSPTLLPLRDKNAVYKVRHGFGYTNFECRTGDINMELSQFVPVSDAVKISRLRIFNLGTETRKFAVTHYDEWVLGSARAATAPFITTSIDDVTRAFMVQNKWTPQFDNQIAFVDMQGTQSSWTGDRLEFLGLYGSLANPQGLAQGIELSNQVGAGLNPCAALQVKIEIKPGAFHDVTVILGAAPDLNSARNLILKYRNENTDQIFSDVKHHWASILGSVTAKTPDPAFDVMMNGWLLYQTLSCRMWARSGFYQASGAYGFRDQLQDSLALMLSRPDLTREHILRAAARQFVEGDVQHWWLPATGTGIRTRFSDDVVWLAYCTSRYVSVTGDQSILDEIIPFLDGPKLEISEVHNFFQPTHSGEAATLYEHCTRALERCLETGSHGLPLMGSGDWNDGMNRVGEAGQGESMWLAWLIIATLKEFSKISINRDTEKLEVWNTKIHSLIEALEKNGWDGAWYRRAFYDDGSTLGSKINTECSIDAIAQSWAAISGSADPARAKSAMAEVSKHLIRGEEKIALLFTPPFDKGEKDPGYIKAYPPGIRENGGQYTHGSAWSIFAFSELGQSEDAWNLFSMLNPINHALTANDVATYRVEPYVMAADIYSIAPHIGRGGWTWYTGAAGVMYRAGIEAILGLQKQGNVLQVRNCMPSAWTEFEASIKFGTARYDITVQRGQATKSKNPEALKQSDTAFEIKMVDDGAVHILELHFAK